MKVLVLYRPSSEHGRVTEEFIHDFTRQYPDKRLTALDIDSREGSSTASLYDVLNYPAILALKDDGSVQNAWQGDALPRLDDVVSYLIS